MFVPRIIGFTAVVFLLLGCFAAADAQSARTAETPVNAKLNAAARLISGLPAPQASQYEFARTPAWKGHSEYMRAAWARLTNRQAAAMTTWQNSELSQACPTGKTLMYPFSGPDFFNAYWLFPKCATMV